MRHSVWVTCRSYFPTLFPLWCLSLRPFTKKKKNANFLMASHTFVYLRYNFLNSMTDKIAMHLSQSYLLMVCIYTVEKILIFFIENLFTYSRESPNEIHVTVFLMKKSNDIFISHGRNKFNSIFFQFFSSSSFCVKSKKNRKKTSSQEWVWLILYIIVRRFGVGKLILGVDRERERAFI